METREEMGIEGPTETRKGRVLLRQNSLSCWRSSHFFVFRDLKSDVESLNLSFELVNLRESAVVCQLVNNVNTSEGRQERKGISQFEYEGYGPSLGNTMVGCVDFPCEGRIC